MIRSASCAVGRPACQGQGNLSARRIPRLAGEAFRRVGPPRTTLDAACEDLPGPGGHTRAFAPRSTPADRRERNERKDRSAQDRLSGETCTVLLATFPEVLRLVEKRAIAPLELEGLTARHPAMKAAKRLAADVRRFRGLVKSLCAQERVGSKQEPKLNKRGPTRTAITE